MWQTLYTYFRNCRKEGTLKIHDSLQDWTRMEKERHPSPVDDGFDGELCYAVSNGLLSWIVPDCG